MFEILIKDSFKRTKRHSRSSSQAPVPVALPGTTDARVARLVQQYQHQRVALARNTIDARNTVDARTAFEQEQGREVTVDGTRYRITRSRSPMDVDNPDRETRSMIVYTEEARASTIPAREEDKEEEGTVVENMETGLGTVVVA